MTNKKTKQEEKGITVQPLGERVIILPDTIEEKKTLGGLIVPGAMENITGVVVAVGLGRVTDSGDQVPLFVSLGDRVILGQYGHEELVFGGKKYYVAPESTLLGIIN